jgi:hypothetical protein
MEYKMESQDEMNRKPSLAKRLTVGFLAVATVGITAGYEAHQIYEGLVHNTSSSTTGQVQEKAPEYTASAFTAPMPDTPYLPPHRPHTRPHGRYYAAIFNTSGANDQTQNGTHVQMVDNGTVSPERRAALERAFEEQKALGNRCAPFRNNPVVLLCFPPGAPVAQVLTGRAFIIDPPVP